MDWTLIFWTMLLLIPLLWLMRRVHEGLQELFYLFEEGHGLVHGRQAGHWEIHLDPLIDLLRTGVILALGQNPQHSHSLWGQTVAPFSEVGDHLVQSDLRLDHSALFSPVGVVQYEFTRTFSQRENDFLVRIVLQLVSSVKQSFPVDDLAVQTLACRTRC